MDLRQALCCGGDIEGVVTINMRFNGIRSGWYLKKKNIQK